jgi:hypothetical protein
MDFIQSPYGGKANGRIDLTVRAPSPAGMIIIYIEKMHIVA